MVLGTARRLEGDDELDALRVITEHLLPGPLGGGPPPVAQGAGRDDDPVARPAEARSRSARVGRPTIPMTSWTRLSCDVGRPRADRRGPSAIPCPTTCARPVPRFPTMCATGAARDADLRTLSLWWDTPPGRLRRPWVTRSPGTPRRMSPSWAAGTRASGRRTTSRRPTHPSASWSSRPRWPASVPAAATAAGRRRCSREPGRPCPRVLARGGRAHEARHERHGRRDRPRRRAEGWDIEWAKGGTVVLARTPLQMQEAQARSRLCARGDSATTIFVCSAR